MKRGIEVSTGRYAGKGPRLRAPEFDPCVPEGVREELRQLFERLYYAGRLDNFHPVILRDDYVVVNRPENWLVTKTTASQ